MDLKKMFIDGCWTEGSEGKSEPTSIPPTAGAGLYDGGNQRGCAPGRGCCRRSFYETRGWRDLDSQSRSDKLLEIADAIEAEKEEFAVWTAWITESPCGRRNVMWTMPFTASAITREF